MVHLSVSIFCFRNSLVGGWRCKMGMILCNSLIHGLYSQSPFQSLLIKTKLMSTLGTAAELQARGQGRREEVKATDKAERGSWKVLCCSTYSNSSKKKKQPYNGMARLWCPSPPRPVAFEWSVEYSISSELSFPAELWHWPQVLQQTPRKCSPGTRGSDILLQRPSSHSFSGSLWESISASKTRAISVVLCLRLRVFWKGSREAITLSATATFTDVFVGKWPFWKRFISRPSP